MKKTLFPALLILTLLISACDGKKAESPIEEPISTAVASESDTTDNAGTSEGATSANDENPCIPFSLMDQVLSTAYPGLPEVSNEDWALGPADAAVTFMEYSEPQCPYCAQIEPIMMAIQELYPNDVRVVFRYRPFPESFHDKSILGSQAMEAAGMQGKFQEFKNWIFERQSKNPNNPVVANLPDSEFWPSVDPDQFDEWLAERVPDLGIDPDQFLKDMFSEAVINKIEQAQSDADTLDIRGTPTLFINGVQWPADSRDINIFAIYTELILHQKNEIGACPEMAIDTSKVYSAIIKTNIGDITVELFDDSAPYAVNSFVYLANQGWYDNLTWIVTDEFALTGDPSDTGNGGPGYAFKDELNPDLNLDEPGMLTLFSPAPGLNGSTFFINKTAMAGQESRTIFGKVTEGLDVLNSLAIRDLFDPAVNRILGVTIIES